MIQAVPSVSVVGPKSPDMPQVNRPVSEGSRVELIRGTDINATVHEIPGHTREHVCFYVEGDPVDPDLQATKEEYMSPFPVYPRPGAGMLFAGDTLFVCGCGRLFEGTPEELHHAMYNVIAKLPSDVMCFVGHEYTLSNIEYVSLPAIALRIAGSCMCVWARAFVEWLRKPLFWLVGL